jgi:hypothetical protein
MNDDDLTILPTAWYFVATFGRGQIRLPRARIAKLAAAALAYLQRFDPAALAAVVAPYTREENR